GALISTALSSVPTALSSVPVVRLEEGPRAAWRVVATLDVGEPPLDLRHRIRLPIRAVLGHLVAWQCLRDSVRAGGLVLRPLVPAALLGPQLVQAGHLVEAEACVQQERASQRPVAAVLVTRARHRQAGLRAARCVLLLPPLPLCDLFSPSRQLSHLGCGRRGLCLRDNGDRLSRNVHCRQWSGRQRAHHLVRGDIETSVLSGLTTGTAKPEVDTGHRTDHQDQCADDAEHRLAAAVVNDLTLASDRPAGTARAGDGSWGCTGSAAVLCGPVNRAAPTLRWWHRVFPSPGARTQRARRRAGRRAGTPRARSLQGRDASGEHRRRPAGACSGEHSCPTRPLCARSTCGPVIVTTGQIWI